MPGGARLDERALQTFTGVARPPLTPRILGVAALADPLPFLVAAAGAGRDRAASAGAG